MLSHLKSVAYAIKQYKEKDNFNENQNPPDYTPTGDEHRPETSSGYTPPDVSPFSGQSEGKSGYQAFPDSRPVIP